MDRLTFKKLTPENMLEPDKNLHWVSVSREDQSVRPMSHKDWIEEILEPQLADRVPAEIVELYEVARGALAYGTFFYPLFTLGTEQLFRVLEAAVTHTCNEMGGPGPKRKYEKKVAFLAKSGAIPKKDEEVWHAARKFRNIVSHQTSQSLLTPVNAVRMLRRVTENINLLFSGEAGKSR